MYDADTSSTPPTTIARYADIPLPFATATPRLEVVLFPEAPT